MPGTEFEVMPGTELQISYKVMPGTELLLEDFASLHDEAHIF